MCHQKDTKQCSLKLKLKSLYLCIAGFTTKTVSLTSLEEYWPYKFKVDAATVKGNKTSDFSSIFRTKQGGKSLSLYFSTNNYTYTPTLNNFWYVHCNVYHLFLTSMFQNYQCNLLIWNWSWEPKILCIHFKQTVLINATPSPCTRQGLTYIDRRRGAFNQTVKQATWSKDK